MGAKSANNSRILYDIEALPDKALVSATSANNNDTHRAHSAIVVTCSNCCAIASFADRPPTERTGRRPRLAGPALSSHAPTLHGRDPASRIATTLALRLPRRLTIQAPEAPASAGAALCCRGVAQVSILLSDPDRPVTRTTRP